jgi:hypothetical protein
MPRRLLVIAILLGAVAAPGALWVSPAFADAPGDLYNQFQRTGVAVDGTDVTVNASIGGETMGAHALRAADVPAIPRCAYSYRPLDPTATSLLGRGGPGPGTWWVTNGPTFCSDSGGTVMNPAVPMWIPAGQSPAADPLVLAREAVAKLPLSPPAIRMSPSADRLLVQLETWLWVDRTAWRQLSDTASVGPVAATALAEPAEVRYDMGDGHQVICLSPGAVYDASVADDRQHTDCGYTYRYASYWQPGGTYTVTATMYWRVRWSSVGAPGGGDLGLVPGPAATVRVHVGEIHAVNVEPSS